jgi:alanine racemase
MPDDAPFYRSAWVEVDLGAIENNTRRLVEIAGDGVELLAMVKANGYGHGTVPVAKASLRGGATWLGVAAVGEGIELRRAGISAPILVAGYTPAHWVSAAVEHGLVLSVSTIELAQAIDEAARRSATRARVHIYVDTGMNRGGVSPVDAPALGRALRSLSHLDIEGVYTHFAMADTPDAHGVAGWGRAYTQRQLEQFTLMLDALGREGISVRYRHAANSPATLNLPEARFNLVRSGILLYGLDPSPEVPRPEGFVAALAFKTEVASVNSVPEGAYVSYGCTFRTTRPTRLAVIAVGYADGFRRAPQNYGQVLIHGRRVPIAGRVCMDQTIVDVTDVEDIRVGDEVVLIGRQGEERISAEEIAERLGTNNYETVATISARVERRYM